MTKQEVTYQAAGVDTAEGARAVDVIKYLMKEGQMMKPGDFIDADLAEHERAGPERRNGTFDSHDGTTFQVVVMTTSAGMGAPTPGGCTLIGRTGSSKVSSSHAAVS